MMKCFTFRFFMISVLTLLVSCSKPVTGILIEDAWVRSPIPGQAVVAGYFTIKNHTDAAVEITSVDSPLFERVEMHTHLMRDGMMSMEQLPSLAIPAQGKAMFSVGADHLMLFLAENTAEQLKEKQTLMLKFNFADGHSIDVSAEIRNN